MLIGVDFDGVICQRTGIPSFGDFAECEPVKDAKEALWWLKEHHKPYILTNRKKKDWGRMRWWLEKWDMPSLYITNEKQLDTGIYLDDRALRFTNWQDIRKLL